MVKRGTISSIIQRVVRDRSEIVVERVISYLKSSNKIIDIGSGTGDVAFLLGERGKKVIPVDVDDFHGPRLIRTIIYDGKTLPFPNRSFDTALLLMVLHHTPNPETVFAEASRVANEVVVIETSYTNPVSKILTVILDTMGNLRLGAFWNSYKTDSEWRELFVNKGFQIVDSHHYKDYNLGVPFLHLLYYLKRKQILTSSTTGS